MMMIDDDDGDSMELDEGQLIFFDLLNCRNIARSQFKIMLSKGCIDPLYSCIIFIPEARRHNSMVTIKSLH